MSPAPKLMNNPLNKVGVFVGTGKDHGESYGWRASHRLSSYLDRSDQAL
jgi:hypothetical protein